MVALIRSVAAVSEPADRKNEHRADGHLELVSAKAQELPNQKRHRDDQRQTPPAEADERREPHRDHNAGDNAEDAAERISDRSHQGHLDDEESRQRRQHRTRVIQDEQRGKVGRDCRTGQPECACGDRPATRPKPGNRSVDDLDPS